jgi:hypothetical protein
MKKFLIFVGVLAVIAAALFIIPSTRDEIQWRLANSKDTTAGYEAYLKAWPNGRHAVEAGEKHDALGWAEAQSAGAVIGFQNYLKLHPQGKHVSDARDSIENLYWQKASQANTIAAYRVFLEGQPNGKHAAEAKTRELALRVDPAPYQAVMKTATEESLQKFIAAYPGHEKETEVQAVLKDIVEGKDIVDLLREKKVEAKVQGGGIESVSVSLRRRVPYAITARIPVGTYFVSANSSAQNMVATAESRVRLDSDDWLEVSPEAACANRPLDIPTGEDSFSIRRSPHQAELARLMPVLEKAGVDVETRQAAVWIITDDADYDDLGTLVASQFGFGGSRVINELETARAMKICEEANINIRSKRIWSDRQMILAGLQDEELKKWLQGKK